MAKGKRSAPTLTPKTSAKRPKLSTVLPTDPLKNITDFMDVDLLADRQSFDEDLTDHSEDEDFVADSIIIEDESSEDEDLESSGDEEEEEEEQAPPPPKRMPKNGKVARKAQAAKTLAKSTVAQKTIAKTTKASIATKKRKAAELIAASVTEVNITNHGNRSATIQQLHKTSRELAQSSRELSQPQTEPTTPHMSFSAVPSGQETPTSSSSPTPEHFGFARPQKTRGIARVEGSSRLVLEYAAGLIKLYTLFREPLPGVLRMPQIFREIWRSAQDDLEISVPLTDDIQRMLKSYQSRVRSHLIYIVKDDLRRGILYGLGPLRSNQQAMKDRVEYLLQDDRFICPPDNYTDCTLRFWAPEIVEVIYSKYFAGASMVGTKDPEFIDRITPTFICLVSLAIWHGLRAWRTGVYLKPDDFTASNTNVARAWQRLTSTWRRPGKRNQEGTLAYIKTKLKARVRKANGEDESDFEPTEALDDDDEALATALQAFADTNKPVRARQWAAATYDDSVATIAAQLEQINSVEPESFGAQEEQRGVDGASDDTEVLAITEILVGIVEDSIDGSQ